MPVIECLKKYFALISETNKRTITILEIAYPCADIITKSCSLITSII